MARIRAIKPEFWSSPNHPADPWARLLYIAMWNWADDAGVGTANLRELAGFAFPNEDQIDTGAMRRLCADIAAHYGAQFYTVGARPYFAIPTWRDHQKFDNRRGGKHPGPENAETWLYQQEQEEPAHCADSAPDSRRSSGAGTGEQGNIGTGEHSLSHFPASSYESAPEENSESANPMCTIPADWAPNDLHYAKFPRPDLDQLAESFRDHAVSVGRRCKGMAGWDAAFGNWVRKSKPPTIPGQGAATTKAQGWLDIVNQLPEDPYEQKAIS